MTACRQYLADSAVGGNRLNTVNHDVGSCFVKCQEESVLLVSGETDIGGPLHLHALGVSSAIYSNRSFVFAERAVGESVERRGWCAVEDITLMAARTAVVGGVNARCIHITHFLAKNTVQRRRVGGNCRYQLLVEVVTAVIGIGEGESKVAMLAASCTQVAGHDSRYIGRVVGSDGVHDLRVGVEIVVGVRAGLGSNGCGHLLGAAVCQIGIEMNGCGSGVVINERLAAGELVVVCLNHTASLA